MSDLLERLRKVENSTGNSGGIGYTNWYRNPDGPEAADEIARLQSMVDAARSVCVEIMAQYGHVHLDAGKYDAANEILRALDGEVKP